jgi:F-type H+-transporting ATPase subunit gamma
VTERLADLSQRIEGIRQLGAVVNAMRGIAAARARQARSQLAAVDLYARTIAAAIARVPAPIPVAGASPSRTALVLFCAEQGFAGAFSEHVLDAIGADLGHAELFLIGTRGRSVAAERGIAAFWTSAMPSHSQGVPLLGDRIAEALYARIAAGAIGRIDAVFSHWQPGHGVRVERKRLFPLDPADFPGSERADPPLLDLTPEALLLELASDYLHAELCKTALHAFAAENEARMEAMAAARGQIERQLSELQARSRQVRQEEITAEIIELAAGETASRAGQAEPGSPGDRGIP